MKLVFILASLLAVACDQKSDPETSSPSEAWDVANSPAILHLPGTSYESITQPKSLQGSVKRPWTDSYWPFQRHNIAHRYLQSSAFLSRDDQVSDALQDPGETKLSPAEKYDLLVGDDSFPLTSESWGIYERLVERYGPPNDEWAWMGICSGWAPASIAETAPREHVIAVNPDGQEVLFYSGDLRALISKAYDINATTEGRRTIGWRCDENKEALVRSSDGRIVDGKLTETGEHFTILSDYSAAAGVVEVQLTGATSEDQKSFWLVASEPLTRLSGPGHLWQYDSRDEVAADVAAGTIGQRASSTRKLAVTFLRGCRDVNPASLHTALVGWLSDAQETPRTFVAEVSRHHEVWNHGVWAFRSAIGKPRPISDDQDALRWFRASGTTHLADVETRLIYMQGSEPRYDYSRQPAGPIDWEQYDLHPERYGTLKLTYTLELDENGVVIGGEWDRRSASGIQVPDFFWTTSGELTDKLRHSGNPSVIKYSLLKKLLACSQMAPDDERFVDAGGTLRYVGVVTCPIE